MDRPVIELEPAEVDLLLKVLTLARNAGWGRVKYSPQQIDPLRRRLRALLGADYQPTL